METLELVLFLTVGGIAILAAVMMLLSENAVHSALFLVLNFACVGFLYLMLNAPFLAMVQVAVYAGAIMVLFMFVIMLLGAERVTPEARPRFPWLTRAAVGLTVLLLLVGGVALLQADIEGTEPEAPPALLRVVNAAPSLGEVAVHLGDTALAEGLGRYETSEFVTVPAGSFDLHLEAEDAAADAALTTQVLLAHREGEDRDLVEASVAELAGLPAGTVQLERAAPHLEIAGGQALTLVLAPMPDGSYSFIPVPEDISSFGNDRFARLQVAHAFTGLDAIELADITVPSDEPHLHVEGLAFGEVSDEVVISPDDYRYGIFEAGTVDAALQAAGEDELANASLEAIVRLSEDNYRRDSSTLLVIAPPPNNSANSSLPVVVETQVENLPAFGSPTSVGRQLFTRYMLPFQVIALLLLVAMIGAIVMTRDAIPPPKPRHPRRLANVAGNPVVEE